MAISLTTLALAKKYSESVAASAKESLDKAIENAIKQSKSYTDSMFSNSAAGFNVKIVDILPNIDEASPKTIYFKLQKTSSIDNIYNEYIAIDGKWEIIGSTNLDLSKYWTIEQVKEYIDNKTYSLPIASTDTPGVVKVDGKSIAITEDGTISVSSDFIVQEVQDGINKAVVPIDDSFINNLF